VIILLITGCRKHFEDPQTVSLKVKVLFPEDYNRQPANNVEVTVTNSHNGLKLTAFTSREGIAIFDSLLPGNYRIVALRSVESQEAKEIADMESSLFLYASEEKQRILENQQTELRLDGGIVGVLIFKEISYAGSGTPAGGSYFSDQFYEIFNNSLTDTIYADSLCIGNVGGSPGNQSIQKPYGFQGDKNNVYLSNIWMVPGLDGTGKSIPILPGKSVIIAQDGINHRTDPLGNPGSIDLGKGIADWESYVLRVDNKDLDAPEVPNLVPIYLGSVGFDWVTAVFGPGMVIFKHPAPSSLPLFTEPGSTSAFTYAQVPNEYILDAVDILANSNAAAFKRMPGAVDAGFTYCSGIYTGESIRRKLITEINGRKVLLDTNNSSEDFTVITPVTPKAW
jgi:hypothetical protein